MWRNEGKTIRTVKLKSQLHFRARPFTSSSPGSRVKSRGRGTGQFTRGGGGDLAASFVEFISDSGLVEEPVAGRSWCSTLRGQILSASTSMLTVWTPCTRGLARTSAHIWICLFSRLDRSKQDMITKFKKNPKHEHSIATEYNLIDLLLKAGNQQDPKWASPHTFTNKFYFNLIHYNNFQLFLYYNKMTSPLSFT